MHPPSHQRPIRVTRRSCTRLTRRHCTRASRVALRAGITMRRRN